MTRAVKRDTKASGIQGILRGDSGCFSPALKICQNPLPHLKLRTFRCINTILLSFPAFLNPLRTPQPGYSLCPNDSPFPTVMPSRCRLCLSEPMVLAMQQQRLCCPQRNASRGLYVDHLDNEKLNNTSTNCASVPCPRTRPIAGCTTTTPPASKASPDAAAIGHARIWVQGKMIHLGYHDHIYDASLIYDQAASQVHRPRPVCQLPQPGLHSRTLHSDARQERNLSGGGR